MSPVLDSSSSSSEESVNIRIFGEFSAGNAPVALLQTLSSHTQLRSYSSNRSHSSSTTRAELIDVLILKTYEHDQHRNRRRWKSTCYRRSLRLPSRLCALLDWTRSGSASSGLYLSDSCLIFGVFSSDSDFLAASITTLRQNGADVTTSRCHGDAPPDPALAGGRARCIVGGVVQRTHLHVKTDRDSNAFIWINMRSLSRTSCYFGLIRT